MAPVGRGLSGRFRVVEPFQRTCGDEPLTVARHVDDLRALIGELPDAAPPALLGSSWGAMLALAYAAEHPRAAGPLVLVGCGTFDIAARAEMRRRLDERLDDDARRMLSSLGEAGELDDDTLAELAHTVLPAYSYDAEPQPDEVVRYDARGHRETWADMLRLQEEGTYPAAFTAIASPVLMLHGADDPHPGELVRASLAPHLRQLEYREWSRCGHYPWTERHVAGEFFELVSAWLLNRAR